MLPKKEITVLQNKYRLHDMKKYFAQFTPTRQTFDRLFIVSL